MKTIHLQTHHNTLGNIKCCTPRIGPKDHPRQQKITPRAARRCPDTPREPCVFSGPFGSSPRTPLDLPRTPQGHTITPTGHPRDHQEPQGLSGRPKKPKGSPRAPKTPERPQGSPKEANKYLKNLETKAHVQTNPMIPKLDGSWGVLALGHEGSAGDAKRLQVAAANLALANIGLPHLASAT